MTTEKRPAKAKPAPKAAGGGKVFTTSELANEHGMKSKTLRARIRRNIDLWQPLFADGNRHVFKDNKTTRAKVAELLA